MGSCSKWRAGCKGPPAGPAAAGPAAAGPAAGWAARRGRHDQFYSLDCQNTRSVTRPGKGVGGAFRPNHHRPPTTPAWRGARRISPSCVVKRDTPLACAWGVAKGGGGGVVFRRTGALTNAPCALAPCGINLTETEGGRPTVRAACLPAQGHHSGAVVTPARTLARLARRRRPDAAPSWRTGRRGAGQPAGLAAQSTGVHDGRQPVPAVNLSPSPNPIRSESSRSSACVSVCVNVCE